MALGVLVFPNPPNSDMDYGIFNVRTDIKACDCTRGCTDIVRESALKVDWEKNPLPPRGIEPTSGACRSDALPKSLRVCGRTNWAVSPWISELDICHKLKVTPRPAEYKGKYSALLFALGSIGFCCCCCCFFFFFWGGGCLGDSLRTALYQYISVTTFCTDFSIWMNTADWFIHRMWEVCTWVCTFHELIIYTYMCTIPDVA